MKQITSFLLATLFLLPASAASGELPSLPGDQSSWNGFEQFDFYEGASIPLIPLDGVFLAGCPLLTAIRCCDFQSASRPNRVGNKT